MDLRTLLSAALSRAGSSQVLIDLIHSAVKFVNAAEAARLSYPGIASETLSRWSKSIAEMVANLVGELAAEARTNARPTPANVELWSDRNTRDTQDLSEEIKEIRTEYAVNFRKQKGTTYDE